jgi:cytidylate kinase
MLPVKPLVTIAALHGTGGAQIGPRVADTLGVAFLDRAIPAAVARRVGVDEDVVHAVDERSRVPEGRWMAALARASNPVTASGHGIEMADADERRIRAEIEAFVARARVSGGVVLGRGGAVVLGSARGALHVYLGGARDARVGRIMERDGVDRRTAERSVDSHDRARREYVRSAYGVDGDAPSLYHLMLDAIGLGVDACVELIVVAARARLGRIRGNTESEEA